jgi:hypothetical protein
MTARAGRITKTMRHHPGYSCPEQGYGRTFKRGMRRCILLCTNQPLVAYNLCQWAKRIPFIK